MHKKSSFNPRDKKGPGGPARKEDSRGGSYKKPYNKEGSSRGGDDKEYRPKRQTGGDKFGKGDGSAKPTRQGGEWKDKGKPGFKPREFGEKRASETRSEDTDRPSRKPYSRDSRQGDDTGAPRGRKPFGDRDNKGGSDAPRRDFSKPYKKENAPGDGGARKPFSRDKPFGDKPSSRAGKRPFPARDNGDERPARKEFGKPYKKEGDNTRSKPYSGRVTNAGKGGEERKETPADFYAKKGKPFKPQTDRYIDDDSEEWEIIEDKKDKRKKPQAAATYPMPLNKYIAHSGECSRRDAAELVRQGKAKVNGELITDPGHKINEEDKVTLSGKKLVPQKGRVYILLNKPKGFITTNDDPKGRRTVMDLVSSADVGRLFAVGRLDRATTGLILLTNDGELAQKLAHPSYNIKKVYQVTLDKRLTLTDFEKIMAGVDLEDGKAVVDEMAYLEQNNEVGVEIHSGKNRIVRRIFESLGYVVEKLDRVMYAGLTKKNLPRSKWRFLDEREIVLLKHFKV